MVLELKRAAETLREQFGPSYAAPYIIGKTAFRDALCATHNISAAEAEMICDSLEATKAITHVARGDAAPEWAINPI